MRLIPQGTLDNNLGLDHLAGTKALYTQSLQTTNTLIVRYLSNMSIFTDLYLMLSKILKFVYMIIYE